jgi:broad-specificity NMP kinase
MNSYLEVLQEKAKNIGANIQPCGYDKDCIKEVLAAKVRSNLEHEELDVIQEKALTIEANITNETKEALLDAIEQRIKVILEEENERYTSIELQQNFIPLDLG